MVTDEGAAGLITPPDGAASHLVLQVSGRTAVPVVSLCADSSVSRTGVPWMVRVVPRTVDEAMVLFTNVAGQPSRTNRWLALVPDGRAGREIARDLKSAAAACHCNLEPSIEVEPELKNVRKISEQVLGNRPDAVLVWLAPLPAAGVAKLLRAAEYSGVLAGPAWLRSTNFIAAAGSAAEGFLISGIDVNGINSPQWRQFQEAYHKEWSHEPDWMAAMSYDAVRLLAQILRQGQFNSSSHRLDAAFSYSGVTGELRFDSEGNRLAKLQVLRGYRDGFRVVSESF
jgi:ABC-type branched-subunit amino acid transport system substrate-binding protein